MTLISILIALLILALVLYAVDLLPFDVRLTRIIQAVVVIFFVLYLLQGHHIL